MSAIMSLRTFSRSIRPAQTTPAALLRRTYASKPSHASSSKAPAETTRPESSCPADTVIPGLNYLKDQPPVVALPDDQYPDWLWKVLEPKEFPPEEQGPGGAAERHRLRRANKEKIKAQNFMKTQ
ncbi:hypothetical protein DL93DRAFT_2165948 [Clavulina sp. PMI_390]|nr:hypothetical protein DL93DRAFT_2165948 [Clavulina sp. PMI_390]